MSDEPKRVRRTGRLHVETMDGHGILTSRKAIESHDDDPDFDELIAAAQDVVDMKIQSAVRGYWLVPEITVERLYEALEPRSEIKSNNCTSCDGHGGLAFVGSTGPGIPCGRCNGTGKIIKPRNEE